MKVLWIDPGLKTGVCLYDAEARKVVLFKIIPNGLAGFRAWWETFGSRYNRPGYDSRLTYDVLGCESFEMEEGTHGIDYESPLAIIHYLESLGIPIVWQRRMQRGKNTVARIEVLKRAGLYPKRGELKEGHQVAALQHLLSYLMKTGHRKTIELLHPKEPE
jgi:hypothetical protein